MKVAGTKALRIVTKNQCNKLRPGAEVSELQLITDLRLQRNSQ